MDVSGLVEALINTGLSAKCRDFVTEFLWLPEVISLMEPWNVGNSEYGKTAESGFYHIRKSIRLHSDCFLRQASFEPHIYKARHSLVENGYSNKNSNSSIMAANILSKSAARRASTASSASGMTKAAGDISSVFPSLRPDYKPEPLPPRFKDLKSSFFQKNEKALKDSWERLLPSMQEEVQKIKEKGSDVCFFQPHLANVN